MKKCPYIFEIEQANQNSYEYDEDGKQTVHTHKLIEAQRPAPCRGKECGAYSFGRCKRKS